MLRPAMATSHQPDGDGSSIDAPWTPLIRGLRSEGLSIAQAMGTLQHELRRASPAPPLAKTTPSCQRTAHGIVASAPADQDEEEELVGERLLGHMSASAMLALSMSPKPAHFPAPLQRRPLFTTTTDGVACVQPSGGRRVATSPPSAVQRPSSEFTRPSSTEQEFGGRPAAAQEAVQNLSTASTATVEQDMSDTLGQRRPRFFPSAFQGVAREEADSIRQEAEKSVEQAKLRLEQIQAKPLWKEPAQQRRHIALQCAECQQLAQQLRAVSHALAGLGTRLCRSIKRSSLAWDNQDIWSTVYSYLEPCAHMDPVLAKAYQDVLHGWQDWEAEKNSTITDCAFSGRGRGLVAAAAQESNAQALRISLASHDADEAEASAGPPAARKVAAVPQPPPANRQLQKEVGAMGRLTGRLWKKVVLTGWRRVHEITRASSVLESAIEIASDQKVKLGELMWQRYGSRAIVIKGYYYWLMVKEFAKTCDASPQAELGTAVGTAAERRRKLANMMWTRLSPRGPLSLVYYSWLAITRVSCAQVLWESRLGSFKEKIGGTLFSLLGRCRVAIVALLVWKHGTGYCRFHSLQEASAAQIQDLSAEVVAARNGAAEAEAARLDEAEQAEVARTQLRSQRLRMDTLRFELYQTNDNDGRDLESLEGTSLRQLAENHLERIKVGEAAQGGKAWLNEEARSMEEAREQLMGAKLAEENAIVIELEEVQSLAEARAEMELQQITFNRTLSDVERTKEVSEEEAVLASRGRLTEVRATISGRLWMHFVLRSALSAFRAWKMCLDLDRQAMSRDAKIKTLEEQGIRIGEKVLALCGIEDFLVRYVFHCWLLLTTSRRVEPQHNLNVCELSELRDELTQFKAQELNAVASSSNLAAHLQETMVEKDEVESVCGQLQQNLSVLNQNLEYEVQKMDEIRRCLEKARASEEAAMRAETEQAFEFARAGKFDQARIVSQAQRIEDLGRELACEEMSHARLDVLVQEKRNGSAATGVCSTVSGVATASPSDEVREQLLGHMQEAKTVAAELQSLNLQRSAVSPKRKADGVITGRGAKPLCEDLTQQCGSEAQLQNEFIELKHRLGVKKIIQLQTRLLAYSKFGGIEGMRNKVRRYDKDGSGLLGVVELKKLLRRELKVDVNILGDKDVHTIIDVLDINPLGGVSVGKFMAFIELVFVANLRSHAAALKIQTCYRGSIERNNIPPRGQVKNRGGVVRDIMRSVHSEGSDNPEKLSNRYHSTSTASFERDLESDTVQQLRLRLGQARCAKALGTEGVKMLARFYDVNHDGVLDAEKLKQLFREDLKIPTSRIDQASVPILSDADICAFAHTLNRVRSGALSVCSIVDFVQQGADAYYHADTAALKIQSYRRGCLARRRLPKDGLRHTDKLGRKSASNSKAGDVETVLQNRNDLERHLGMDKAPQLELRLRQANILSQLGIEGVKEIAHLIDINEDCVLSASDLKQIFREKLYTLVEHDLDICTLVDALDGYRSGSLSVQDLIDFVRRGADAFNKARAAALTIQSYRRGSLSRRKLGNVQQNKPVEHSRHAIQSACSTVREPVVVCKNVKGTARSSETLISKMKSNFSARGNVEMRIGVERPDQHSEMEALQDLNLLKLRLGRASCASMSGIESVRQMLRSHNTGNDIVLSVDQLKHFLKKELKISTVSFSDNDSSALVDALDRERSGVFSVRCLIEFVHQGVNAFQEANAAALKIQSHRRGSVARRSFAARKMDSANRHDAQCKRGLKDGQSGAIGRGELTNLIAQAESNSHGNGFIVSRASSLQRTDSACRMRADGAQISTATCSKHTMGMGRSVKRGSINRQFHKATSTFSERPRDLMEAEWLEEQQMQEDHAARILQGFVRMKGAQQEANMRRERSKSKKQSCGQARPHTVETDNLHQAGRRSSDDDGCQSDLGLPGKERVRVFGQYSYDHQQGTAKSFKRHVENESDILDHGAGVCQEPSVTSPSKETVTVPCLDFHDVTQSANSDFSSVRHENSIGPHDDVGIVGRKLTLHNEVPAKDTGVRSVSGFCSLEDPLIQSMLSPTPKARRNSAGPVYPKPRRNVASNMFSVRQSSPPRKLRLKPRSSSNISKSTASSFNAMSMSSPQMVAQLTSEEENREFTSLQKSHQPDVADFRARSLSLGSPSGQVKQSEANIEKFGSVTRRTVSLDSDVSRFTILGSSPTDVDTMGGSSHSASCPEMIQTQETSPIHWPDLLETHSVRLSLASPSEQAMQSKTSAEEFRSKQRRSVSFQPDSPQITSFSPLHADTTQVGSQIVSRSESIPTLESPLSSHYDMSEFQFASLSPYLPVALAETQIDWDYVDAVALATNKPNSNSKLVIRQNSGDSPLASACYLSPTFRQRTTDKQTVDEDPYSLGRKRGDSRSGSVQSQKGVQRVRSQNQNQAQDRRGSPSFSSPRNANVRCSGVAQSGKLADTRRVPLDTRYDAFHDEYADNNLEHFSPVSDGSPSDGSPISGRRRSTVPRWLSADDVARSRGKVDEEFEPSMESRSQLL